MSKITIVIYVLKRDRNKILPVVSSNRRAQLNNKIQKLYSITMSLLQTSKKKLDKKIRLPSHICFTSFQVKHINEQVAYLPSQPINFFYIKLLQPNRMV
jgi:hypothetical protein